MKSARDYKLIAIFGIPFVIGMTTLHPVLKNWFFTDDFYWLQFSKNAIETPGLLITHRLFNYYRPVINIIFVLEFLWAGLSSVPRHALNLVLHCLTTSMIAAWLFRLVKNRPVAAMVPFLFLFSPPGLEAVCWVSGRADVLAAFFMMTSLLLMPGENTQQPRKTLSVLSLILAVLTKEIAVLTVVVIYFQDHITMETFRIRNWIASRLPWIITCLAGIAVHSILQMTGKIAFSTLGQPLTSLQWLKNIFSGSALTITGSIPLWYSVDRYGAAVIFILVALICMTRSAIMVYGTITTFLLMIPAAAMPFSFLPVPHLTFGRFLYIPAIGVTLIWAGFLKSMSDRIHDRFKKHIAIIIIISLPLIMSYYRAGKTLSVWRAVTVSQRDTMSRIKTVLEDVPVNKNVVIIVPDTNVWLEMFELFSGRPVKAVRYPRNIHPDSAVYLFDRGFLTELTISAVDVAG